MPIYLLKLNGQYVNQMYYTIEPETSNSVMDARFYTMEEIEYWIDVSRTNECFIGEELEFEIETYIKEKTT